MNSTLKIGILGAGSIGSRHAANLASLGVTDLIFWEPEKSARQRAANETPARFAESREAFWASDPDVVFVCTPSGQHLEDTREAVAANRSVFVEKPFATTLPGGIELAAEAERKGLTTMVACNMRFHPGPQAIKAVVESRQLGDIFSVRWQAGSYLPNWRPWQDYKKSYSADPRHGGIVLDGIHEIDLALWVFGPARLVGGIVLPATSLNLESDGLAEFVLRHQNGVVSSLHLNYLQRDYRRSCQILGTKGSLYWDFTAAEIKIFGEDGNLAVSQTLPPPKDVNAMYVSELQHFLDSVRGGHPSCNPLRQGFAALEIAAAVRELRQ